MKRIKFMAISLLMLLAANGMAQGINWQDYKKVGMPQVLDMAKKEHKYVFVDIWTPWCGVCKAIAKYIFPRKDVSEYFNQNFVNLTFDAEYGNWGEVGRKFCATAYPTILILNDKGDIVWAIDNLGVPTPQQQNAEKSDVSERLMEQAKMGMRLENMSTEEFTDSTTFAFMKKYSVGFNTLTFKRLIANKEIMQNKYGKEFVRLCKESLGSAAANMLTYGKGGTHTINHEKMAIYEDVTKQLNLPETPSLLLEPKLYANSSLGNWTELLNLVEANTTIMTPYMYAAVIGDMADGCNDKQILHRAAPIFKKAMNLEIKSEREKRILTECYKAFEAKL